MRRRGMRELIEEMRAERLAREAELARWRADFEQHRLEWRAEFEDYRREWRARVEADRRQADADRIEQKRRFDAIDTAMENDRRVTREILLELREGREMLRDMRHGIQANTEGLLRVLDELRRSDGPSAAGA